MADEFDKPLGAPQSLPKSDKITQHEIHTIKKPLNWRGFFIGLVIVLIIEWFAIKALTGDDPKILPSIIPSQPPSPTITQKETDKWGKYTDEKTGFTFLYPADTYLLETATAEKKDTLRIETFAITEPEKYLAGDFHPNDYQNVITAIEKGTAFSSLSPGNKDNYKTIRFGSNNFVRIFPGESTKCDCDQIKYVTIVKNNYIVISMEKQKVYPSPQITGGVSPEEIIRITENDFQEQLQKEPDKLILQRFGPIEKVLATFATL